MGTEVLRAQDLFVDHSNISKTPPFHRRSRVSPNITLLVDDKISADRNNKNYKKAKKSPITKKTKKAVSDLGHKDEITKVRKLVNGNVTLLKRGEKLDSIVTNSKPTNTLNPIDAISLKQIKVPARYAGSVISTLSPSPRALPQPSFFIRKRENDELVLDNFATNNLRRLLRLE